jgi:WXG100 family type VII secretion target
MGERLRVEYDVLQQSSASIRAMQDEIQSGLNALNGVAGQILGATWQGLAATLFTSWWQGASQQASAIQNELNNLQMKLDRISQMVQESDQETANLFTSSGVR